MNKTLIILTLLFVFCGIAEAKVITFKRGENLQTVIDYAADGDTIIVAAKQTSARAKPFEEALCGNCEDPRTVVTASTGFVIRNKSLVIIGENRYRSILITNAGYGVYIENSSNTILKNLTITGGVRDNDGNATSGAIVVRNSSVLIESCDIRDNDRRASDSSVVVGIGGVIGREGAELTIRDCYIYNNGWDGVALYRGAQALIADCVIKKGRGAGIGVTWDASCIAYRNDVSQYWKGIGAFGSSWVIARNNFVHDNLGWGIIATGSSFMDITNNDVYKNGNCGVAPWSLDSRGRIVNNIISSNGWRDQWVCPCVGVWNFGDWAKWTFTNNIVWGNIEGEYQDIWDQTGFNGNISIDPMYIDSLAISLMEDSPAWQGGDSLIYNRDGSRSHIGRYGGPQAKVTQ